MIGFPVMRRQAQSTGTNAVLPLCTTVENTSHADGAGAFAIAIKNTGATTMRRDLITMRSPYLVRANLRARNSIIAQMADDFRVVVTRRGYVDQDDLELLGWTPAQIASCGADARRRAQALDLRVSKAA